MSTADRRYFTRLIIASVFCIISVTLAGVNFFLSRQAVNVRALMEWSKKADFAKEMLDDLFEFQQEKEAYKRQGIGADEATYEVNQKKRRECNAKNKSNSKKTLER